MCSSAQREMLKPLRGFWAACSWLRPHGPVALALVQPRTFCPSGQHMRSLRPPPAAQPAGQSAPQGIALHPPNCTVCARTGGSGRIEHPHRRAPLGLLPNGTAGQGQHLAGAALGAVAAMLVPPGTTTCTVLPSARAWPPRQGAAPASPKKCASRGRHWRPPRAPGLPTAAPSPHGCTCTVWPTGSWPETLPAPQTLHRAGHRAPPSARGAPAATTCPGSACTPVTTPAASLRNWV